MPREAEAEGDRRVTAVRGDRHACGDRRLTAPGADDRAADRPRHPLLLDNGSPDRDAWLELTAHGDRLLQEQPVEVAPRDRPPFHASGIPTLDRDAARAGHAHAAD